MPGFGARRARQLPTQVRLAYLVPAYPAWPGMLSLHSRVAALHASVDPIVRFHRPRGGLPDISCLRPLTAPRRLLVSLFACVAKAAVDVAGARGCAHHSAGPLSSLAVSSVLAWLHQCPLSVHAPNSCFVVSTLILFLRCCQLTRFRPCCSGLLFFLANRVTDPSLPAADSDLQCVLVLLGDVALHGERRFSFSSALLPAPRFASQRRLRITARCSTRWRRSTASSTSASRCTSKR